MDHEKYVLGTDGEIRRYDLSVDPKEMTALAAQEANFQALLEVAEIDFTYEGYAPPEFTEPTERMRENLKGLGYLR